MLSDQTLRTSIIAMLDDISAPPAPTAAILAAAATPAVVRAKSLHARYAVAAAAAIALIFTLPGVSPAVVASLGTAYQAIVRGIYFEPRIPRVLFKQLTPDVATLARAQTTVPFTIVQPMGLPVDVVSSKITTASSGIYNSITHTWKKADPYLSFTYKRRDGRVFRLLAERADPRMKHGALYIEEPADTGKRIIRHRNFVWRNGDQQISVAAGPDLSAREITTILVAMHGIPLPLIDEPYDPNAKSTRFQVRLLSQ